MLKNYLKIGIRNLLKNKLFTLINISGMAISIASCLIIGLFVFDEHQFDKHVEDVDLKYRVFNEHFNDDGQTRKAAMVPPMIGPTLDAEYPEVDSYARYMNFNQPVLFEYGDKKMIEDKGGYADPSIIEMFDLKLIEGDIAGALKGPGSIAINRTLKEKYFGSKPALNEPMQVFDEDFKVSAVFEDFPAHSHFQVNYFVAMDYITAAIPQRMQSWQWNQFNTYIKLKPGTDALQLEAKLLNFAERNAWPVTKPNGGYYIPHLMPMEKIHLHASDQVWDVAVRGNAQTVYILSGTAIFIIIIAILNFINLSTARAVSRVKEVGVRKVVGALRKQLVYQFISESVIVAFVSLLIGGLLTQLAIPALNSFTEKSIPAGLITSAGFLGVMLVFAIILGLAAGAYPAFYISSYKPAMILSNRQSGASGKTLLRKSLVVLQFILSFFLIIAALVVSEQHTFMRTKDMGFDKNNVIALPLRGDMGNNLDATKRLFSDHPNVISATLGYGLPGEAYAGDGVRDKATNKDWHINLLTVDHDYVKTLGLSVIAGRDFSQDYPSDTADAFLINEAAAKMFGYADAKDALGHELSWGRWDDQSKRKEGKVIGIVKDFHLNSLHENILPLMLQIYPFAYNTITLKVKPEHVPETIAYLETSWKKMNTEWPFEYRFLDKNFDKMYKAEEKLATLFTFFTFFTIFVACLGLFGLVVYSTTQKYKEISIRKVLGAGEGDLVIQLAQNYMLLIAIAFVVAIPVSFLAAQRWLEKFPYRIEITPMLFVKAGLFIMILSLITIGIQSLKAARSNPVNALKEQ